LLAAADAAMYEAKQAGKNTWRLRELIEAPNDGA
jgi:PleD family two-component response regulator